MPSLCEVSFYRDFRLDYDTGDVEIGHNRNGTIVWFRARELYRNKEKAERAVLTQRDSWIAEEQSKNDEMRARLFPAAR